MAPKCNLLHTLLFNGSWNSSDQIQIVPSDRTRIRYHATSKSRLEVLISRSLFLAYSFTTVTQAKLTSGSKNQTKRLTFEDHSPSLPGLTKSLFNSSAWGAPSGTLDPFQRWNRRSFAKSCQHRLSGPMVEQDLSRRPFRAPRPRPMYMYACIRIYIYIHIYV